MTSGGSFYVVLGSGGHSGSQMASEGSFGTVLGSDSKMTSRWPLDVHVELWWALVAEWLSDGLSFCLSLPESVSVSLCPFAAILSACAA